MKVVRTGQMEWSPAMTRGKFANRRKELGGERLRCGLWELAPGKTSFPMHAHHVTEEALFALSGHAKVRTPDGETEIGPGDYVSFPAGGVAHQLVNPGAEPFVYVGMSAVGRTDIVEYPETGKISCAIGSFPTGKRFIFKVADQTDYFSGEE